MIRLNSIILLAVAGHPLHSECIHNDDHHNGIQAYRVELPSLQVDLLWSYILFNNAFWPVVNLCVLSRLRRFVLRSATDRMATLLPIVCNASIRDERILHHCQIIYDLSAGPLTVCFVCLFVMLMQARFCYMVLLFRSSSLLNEGSRGPDQACSTRA